MLINKTVKSFVIAVNADESKNFYSDMLGFKLISEDAYGLEFEMNHGLLRVNMMKGHQPQKYTVLGWSVSDIMETMEWLKTRGIQFEKYDIPGQDDMGIWSAPNGTRVAWFKDPAGNILSIDQKK